MKSFNNFKIYNEEQNRVIDSNGFLYVKKSPILKSGILDYYGEELEKDVVDGVKIQPDKIYKVYIPKDELKKSLNSFKLKPIVEDHEWLGKDGSNAKGKQEGTTGENAYIDGEYLMIDLQFNNLDTIEKIQNNEKRELSASYQNNLIKAPAGADYDFVATDIQPNHIALVERGRCGSDVRVYNNLLTTNKKKMIKLVIDGKELDLEKFIGEEQQEGEHDESIQDVENEKSSCSSTLCSLKSIVISSLSILFSSLIPIYLSRCTRSCKRDIIFNVVSTPTSAEISISSNSSRTSSSTLDLPTKVFDILENMFSLVLDNPLSRVSFFSLVKNEKNPIITSVFNYDAKLHIFSDIYKFISQRTLRQNKNNLSRHYITSYICRKVEYLRTKKYPQGIGGKNKSV